MPEPQSSLRYRCGRLQPALLRGEGLLHLEKRTTLTLSHSVAGLGHLTQKREHILQDRRSMAVRVGPRELHEIPDDIVELESGFADHVGGRSRESFVVSPGINEVPDDSDPFSLVESTIDRRQLYCQRADQIEDTDGPTSQAEY